MVSRHSVFYSPLIATIAAGFLERHGLEAEYLILAKGQRSSALIAAGEVDIMQSAVSSNWLPIERGESPLPVHFAQINQRDGFFLVARGPAGAFQWSDLVGQTLLADHAPQPLVMLKYAARVNSVGWTQVDVINAGSPDEMVRAFRHGRGTYVQLQSPAAHQLEFDGVGHVVASVGASMPPVAFSSLCASREFTASETCRQFLEAYSEARTWVRTAPSEDVAQAEAGFFPGFSRDALAAGIRGYQKIGCWEGRVEIPRDLYEQALTVFETEGGISRRQPYEAVCVRAL